MKLPSQAVNTRTDFLYDFLLIITRTWNRLEQKVSLINKMFAEK